MTPPLPPLVATDWLADRLDDADLRIYDTTVHMSVASNNTYSIESGRAGFEEQHIPGAGFLDLTRELNDSSSPLGFTMPAAGQMSDVLGSAGIDAASRVVVYSATTQMWATRVWWMLRASGIEQVALLDGGLGKWLSEGRPVSDAPCAYTPTEVRCVRRAAMWADRDEVLAAIGDSAVCTLNALPAPLHTGESPFSYGRKGHIAGSRNVPYDRLLVPGTQTYRPLDELRQAFDESGALTRERVICYCGGGISATTDAFALRLLGHSDVAVYDGSLREWAEDDSLPMESGAS